MDEDDDFFEPAQKNPASDYLAQVLRWIGLVSGLAMLGWTATMLR